MANISTKLLDLSGCRVTVVGLGTFGGGVATVRFLAEQNARITITDLKSEDALADSLQQLSDISVERVLTNGHPDTAFDNCDLVVLNPAVKPDAAVMQQIQHRGLPVTTETELLLLHCQGTVIAVTGSNGKSTTAALTAHLLKRCQARQVWLGGNIGRSLLPNVHDIGSEDLVVLELSSFQLHYLADSRFSPSIAMLTGFAPNHLDWHRSIDHYQRAKQVLFNHQRPQDVAIVNDGANVNLPAATADQRTWRIRSRCLRFGLADTGEAGVFAVRDEGSLLFCDGRSEDALQFSVPQGLYGEHNLQNIAAAACAAWCAQSQPQDIVRALADFSPLPHRMQHVVTANGRTFINDSASTTPESTVAALRSLRQPTVVIAGGADKGADLTELAHNIAEHAIGAVLIGQTAERLYRLITDQLPADRHSQIRVHRNFESAFNAAVELAPNGGIVLLSPGCASFGWFTDYRQRGEQFCQLARNRIQES